MTKKWAIIALFILGGSFAALSAQPVSRSAAISKAQQLLQSKGLTFNREKSMKLAGDAQSSPYYILRADGDGGFAIVSGEESAPAIIGYSSTATVDPSNLPTALQSWLKGYAAQIEYIREHNLKLAPRSVTDAGVPIPSQLKSKWNQAPVYNNSCPIITLYSDADCTQLYTRHSADGTIAPVAGCAATAAAQVLRYYRYPAGPVADIPERTDFVWQSTDFREKDAPAIWQKFTDPAVSSSFRFDYDNMLDQYVDDQLNLLGTETQQRAVADLMHVVGSALNMRYGYAGAVGSQAYNEYILEGLYKYLGFPNVIAVKQHRFGYQEWVNTLYSDLSAARVIFLGGSSTGGGHGFVIDGYDKEDYFSVNWGWGGACDGYYRLGNLLPVNQDTGEPAFPDGFNISQIYFRGLYPDAPAADPVVYCNYFNTQDSWVMASDYPDDPNYKYISFNSNFQVCNESTPYDLEAYLGILVFDSDGKVVDEIPIHEVPVNLGKFGNSYGTVGNANTFDYDLDVSAGGVKKMTIRIAYRLRQDDPWTVCPGNDNGVVFTVAPDNVVTLQNECSYSLDVVERGAADTYSNEEPIEFTSRLKVQSGSLHEPLIKCAVPKDPQTGELNYDGEVLAGYDMFYGEKGDEFDINFSLPAGKLPVGTYTMGVYNEIGRTFVPLFDLTVTDTATSIDSLPLTDYGLQENGQSSMVNGQWYDLNGRPLPNGQRSMVNGQLRKGLYIQDRQVIAVP